MAHWAILRVSCIETQSRCKEGGWCRPRIFNQSFQGSHSDLHATRTNSSINSNSTTAPVHKANSIPGGGPIDFCSVVQDTNNKVYNYTRVLCHYSSLVRDAWAKGDGARVYRYWRLRLPHFKAAGRTKYSLEALRLQFQVQCILSPQLAHHVVWDRLVCQHKRWSRTEYSMWSLQCQKVNCQRAKKYCQHIFQQLQSLSSHINYQ